MTTTKKNNSRFVSLTDAAEILSISRRTARRLIASGDLPAYRIGDVTLRIERSDIELLLRPIPTSPSRGVTS